MQSAHKQHGTVSLMPQYQQSQIEHHASEVFFFNDWMCSIVDPLGILCFGARAQGVHCWGVQE